MELAVSPEHLHRITQHCQQAYPYEGCGMLLGWAENGRKVVVDVFPTGNAREENAQHNRYLIPPEDILKGELEAEKRGLDVIGYFHSHPDHPARPSEFDRDHAWPWYSYLILAVHDGRAIASRSWQLCEDRSSFDEEIIISLSSNSEE